MVLHVVLSMYDCLWYLLAMMSISHLFVLGRKECSNLGAPSVKYIVEFDYAINS